MKRFFQSEKFPAAYALLVATVAWGITHGVDRILDRPLVEYAHSQEAASGIVHHRFQIRNLTSKLHVSNLRFIVALPPNGSSAILAAETQVLPPAIQGGSAAVHGADYASFPVETLQPGEEIDLRADIKGTDQPVLQLSVPTQPVYLERRSIETFMVANEMRIIAAICGVGVVSMIVYAFCFPAELP